jgi:hypothetical protein
MSALMPVPQHFGGLHPYETALLVLLAFGPFVVLAFVVVVMRRRDAATESDEPSDSIARPPAGGTGRPGDQRRT